MDCDVLERRLSREISEGSTRFRANVKVAELRELLALFRSSCSVDLADYYELLIARSFEGLTVAGVIERLNELLGRPRLDVSAKINALSLLASVSSRTMPVADNVALRKRAFRIARRQHCYGKAIAIQANLAFFYLTRNELNLASRAISSARRLINGVDPIAIKADLAYEEVAGRLMTHEAKLLVRQIKTGRQRITPQVVRRISRLYDDAIERDIAVDHRRINFRIEAAGEFLILFSIGIPAALPIGERFLSDASQGLEAHNCPYCPGYYHYVNAMCLWFRAREAEKYRHTASFGLLRRALSQAEQSASQYGLTGHPNQVISRSIGEKLNQALSVAQRPRKVFLSYRTRNRDLVRRFKTILSELGFEPWLDEDAMSAGAPRDRSIKKGMQDSCAAIFFVTSDFVDRTFVAAEIDYAVHEYITRGPAEFRIVTLVFGEEVTAKVPELLETYKWTTPANELDALREILRALPIQLTAPGWPDSPEPEMS